MRAHNWDCHSFPITDGLLHRASDAHKEYEKRKAEQREEKERRKNEENERNLRDALDKEMASNSKMKSVKEAEETVRI